MTHPYIYPGLPPKPLQEAFRLCCREFGRSQDEVRSQRRKGEFVDVRKAFCLIAYEIMREQDDGKPSPSKIGRVIGMSHDEAIYHHKTALTRIHTPGFSLWNFKVEEIRRKLEEARQRRELLRLQQLQKEEEEMEVAEGAK